MKKIIYVLILPLVVVSGLVFAFGQSGLKPSVRFATFADGPGAGRETKNATSNKPTPNPVSVAERKAASKKWEASPDGIMYKKWKASPAGKKVHAAAAKISKSVRDYSNMPAIVTSLSLPPGSRLGFGVMVSVNGADYILAFGPESDQFKQLRTLKVNDRIIIRSHGVSHAPKYAHPIISGDYVARDGKIIYKRAPRKGGC